MTAQGCLEEGVKPGQLWLARHKDGWLKGFFTILQEGRGLNGQQGRGRCDTGHFALELKDLLGHGQLLALEGKLHLLAAVHLSQGLLYPGQHPAELAELAPQLRQATGQRLLDLSRGRSHGRLDAVDRL